VQVLAEEPPDFHTRIKRPLFAVDFVGYGGGLVAIDFNLAPGLRGTGLENVLSPSEVYRLIEVAWRHFRDEGEGSNGNR
jgi:hypothetical protein